MDVQITQVGNNNPGMGTTVNIEFPDNGDILTLEISEDRKVAWIQYMTKNNTAYTPGDGTKVVL